MAVAILKTSTESAPPLLVPLLLVPPLLVPPLLVPPLLVPPLLVPPETAELPLDPAPPSFPAPAALEAPELEAPPKFVALPLEPATPRDIPAVPALAKPPAAAGAEPPPA